MKIEGSVYGTELIIELEGRIDIVFFIEFEQFLNEKITEYISIVVFDFKNVLYISSSGLRLLLTVQKKMNAINGSMTLKNVNSFVMDILDSVGLSDILTIK